MLLWRVPVEISVGHRRFKMSVTSTCSPSRSRRIVTVVSAVVAFVAEEPSSRSMVADRLSNLAVVAARSTSGNAGAVVCPAPSVLV